MSFQAKISGHGRSDREFVIEELALSYCRSGWRAALWDRAGTARIPYRLVQIGVKVPALREMKHGQRREQSSVGGRSCPLRSIRARIRHRVNAGMAVVDRRHTTLRHRAVMRAAETATRRNRIANRCHRQWRQWSPSDQAQHEARDQPTHECENAITSNERRQQAFRKRTASLPGDE